MIIARCDRRAWCSFRGGPLALALNNLGTQLAEACDFGEALIHARQTVTILEDLHRAFPGRYRADLRDGVTNLANRLDETGHYEEASRRAQAIRFDHGHAP